MWKVSEAYKKAIVKQSRKFKAAVTVTYKSGERAVFTDETIMNGIVIHSQMVSGDENSNTIDIGAVPEKKLEITVLDTDSDLHKYAGARLDVVVSLLLENGEWEPVPMGVFFVDASALSRVGTQINIVAYDGMINFQFTISDTLRTQLNSLPLSYVARIMATGAGCGFDQDISGLPNSYRIYKFNSLQIVTGWDCIMWIAQVMGCFAKINRENKLEFVPIKFTWESLSSGGSRIVEDRTIYESERYDGITFSDDRMHIVGVATPGEGKYITSDSVSLLDSDSNVTILLEKNPLLQFTDDSDYNEDVTKRVLNEMMGNLSTVYFYAFQTDIENDPSLDAGDVVRLRGGVINGTNKNNDLYGFITHSTWRYSEQQTITSTGQTPIIYSETQAGISSDFIQPQTQSAKLINSLTAETQAISAQTKELTETVKTIVESGNGADRLVSGSRYYLFRPITTSYTDTFVDGSGKYHADTTSGYGAEFTYYRSSEEQISQMVSSNIHLKAQDIKGAAYILSLGTPLTQFFDFKHGTGFKFYYHTGQLYDYDTDRLEIGFGNDAGIITMRKKNMTATGPSLFLSGVDAIYINDTLAWSKDMAATYAAAQPRPVAAKPAEEDGAEWTYEEDGIHINHKGRTAVIPWKE